MLIFLEKNYGMKGKRVVFRMKVLEAHCFISINRTDVHNNAVSTYNDFHVVVHASNAYNSQLNWNLTEVW